MLASSFTFLQHQSEKVLLKHYSWHHQGYRCSIHRHDTPGCLMSNWSPRHHTEGIPLSDTLKWNWITLNLNKLSHSCGRELDCQQTDSVGQVQWGCIMSTGFKWQMATLHKVSKHNRTITNVTGFTKSNKGEQLFTWQAAAGLDLPMPVPVGEAELIVVLSPRGLHHCLDLTLQEQVKPQMPGEECQAVMYCGLHNVTPAYSLCVMVPLYKHYVSSIIWCFMISWHKCWNR